AQAKLAKKDKEDKEDKDSKNKISNKDIVSLENEVSEESFTYDIELDFIKDYASEMAKDKVKEYFAINNMTRKKKIISEIGYTGCSDEEVLEVIADGLQQDGMDFLATSVDALKTMNKPSNEKIVNILLNLLDAERPDHRYMGVQGLKYMSASPDKILPKLIDTFFSENNDYLRKQYAECASSYGKEALDYAYKLLEEKSRVDRRPVALFIHEMTGEKVDDLVNR
ncbi:MAG: hypothetical protein IKP71_10625, partial [Candidatus Riflebacteria bacterium]|nr:hypothetical protein [Candidatus Riflebacteria bacterium]